MCDSKSSYFWVPFFIFILVIVSILKVNINIELIAACLSNNRAAQRKLYDNLMPYLNFICKRYLVNESDLGDVLQDTFIKIFKNLHQFDLEKASFKTWATKIAINFCFKKNAHNNRHTTQELIIGLHEPEVSPEVLDKLSNEELLAWMKQMPKLYFEVFNLYVVDGFSHVEIAELLGIDPALSRQRLSRSRDWLKKKLPSDFRSRFRFSIN